MTHLWRTGLSYEVIAQKVGSTEQRITNSVYIPT